MNAATGSRKSQTAQDLPPGEDQNQHTERKHAEPRVAELAVGLGQLLVG